MGSKNDTPRGRIATAFHYATQFKRPMTLYAFTVIAGFTSMWSFFLMIPDNATVGAGITVFAPALPMVAAIGFTYLWAKEAIKANPRYFDDDPPRP